MRYVYCTLFDSSYIDRGIVMAESLAFSTQNYVLYVLAMDDLCQCILNERKISNVVVISLSEFEDEKMIAIRKERTRREYCWTCSSVFIRFLFEKKNVRNCTYIDADMLFYRSPNFMVDNIIDSGCSIGIIEHRFPRNWLYDRQISQSGKYCVEFNTFINDKNGREALDWWVERCILNCQEKSDGIVFGDQLYLNDWPNRFERVYIHNDIDSGIAPWNIMLYKFNHKGEMAVKHSRNIVNPVFYHFHKLEFLGEDFIKMGVMCRFGHKDKRLLLQIYSDYIKRIVSVRGTLGERVPIWGIQNDINKGNGGTKRSIKRFIQKAKTNGIIYELLCQYYEFTKKRDIFPLGELLNYDT